MTGDGQMDRKEGGPMEGIYIEYQNIPECRIRNDSGFSRPMLAGMS